MLDLIVLQSSCLFTDVEPRGGPTLVCPAALPAVCKHLYDHPEGGWDNKLVFSEALKHVEEYEYLTGKAGDVFLYHPFMVSHTLFLSDG